MTRSDEVRIPPDWTTSVEAANAAEILGPERKRYQEMHELAIFCHCVKRPQRLVRFFSGSADEDNSTRVWVLVNERARGGTGRPTIPALAEAVKRTGEAVVPLVAECRHCKVGILVLPCGVESAPLILATSRPGGYLVIGSSSSPQASAFGMGDETEVRAVRGYRRGPAGTVLADLDPPVHGNVHL